MAKARFEIDGDLGVLTLADPPLNLVGLALVGDLETAMDEAERADVRAMLIEAQGLSFSAGAHVGELFQNVSEAQARALLQRFANLSRRFSQLPVPSVVAVQGMCLAAGLEIALGCDLVWAADSASMGLVEAMIGAVPFAGGTQRVAERAGAGRAYEMAYTGRVYDAATMERWGVINRVVPAADLARKTRSFAKRLAAGPTRAHAVSKQLMRLHLDEGARAANEGVVALCPAVFETRDMQHGVASLLAHGPGQATFEGR